MEEQADQPHSMRWIVLIAYLMGLSIGVHILNLLTVPALVFIYYFRKTQRITFKGIAVSTLISGAIWFSSTVSSSPIRSISAPCSTSSSSIHWDCPSIPASCSS